MELAQRLNAIETSAIRELFKLLGKPGIISFAGGFPDPNLFDSQGIQDATNWALTNNHAKVLQYGATEGWDTLREQIACMQNKNTSESHIHFDDLIVTTGSQQALDLVGKVLINPGDTVIVEAPTFLATIQCFRLYGANLVSVPTDENGLDVEKLESLIKQHKPKMVYLIPTFSNPSGVTLSTERRVRVLELAVKYKTILVEDAPYSELYFDHSPPPSLLALSKQVQGSRDWLLHCGSFSKIISPGLRVGWLVAPKKILAAATMCKQFSDAHTSNLTQAIVARYLTQDRLETTLKTVRTTYAQRAKTMQHSIKNHFGNTLKFNTPKGGMFLWVELMGEESSNARKMTAQDFATKAIAHNVAFVPGAPFYATNPNPQTLRLSFATANEIQIEEGVQRLKKAFFA